MHGDHDLKVWHKDCGDKWPDSMTHGNPGDRNEAQIEITVTPVLASEHHPQHGQYRRTLATAFCQRGETELLSGGWRWSARHGRALARANCEYGEVHGREETGRCPLSRWHHPNTIRARKPGIHSR